MSDPLIQYAFVAGEISPTLHGRTDLEKYDLGLALIYNFYVDYRGGISTRSGTEFIEFLQNTASDARLFKFQFSPDTSNTYVVIVGDGWLRFAQSGAMVVEADVTITAVTKAKPGVVTAAAHGFSAGDLVIITEVVGMTELNGRAFTVGAVTTNTFELENVWGGDFDTSDLTVYVSGGVVNRVYTVATPWNEADIARLVASQRRDEMVFTHPDYAPYKLVRSAATTWTLTAVDFDTRTDSPTGLTLTPSTAGTAGVVFGVTAVKNGQESPPIKAFTELTVNYTNTAGSMKVTWDIQDADHYLVYRSVIIPTGSEITLAQELGFVGRALGPQFIDNNIIPDFTLSPPEFDNPFASGGVESIEVTAVGSGYAKSDTVSVSGGSGSGFEGFPVVNDGGEVIAVVVTSPGSGYTTPVVSFTTAAGTGATATATLTPATGNYPSTNRIFQQRRVYAGTTNDPMTIFGSRINDFENFDVSQDANADDSYQYTLDAELVAPIRHTLPAQNGLVIMSEGGVWLLRGAEGRAVDPTNAVADPQSYNGCSFVPPILIDTDILYTQEKGAVVRALSFNDFSKVFAGTDVSTLANHLFKGRGKIERWTYAEDPFKLIWAVREDGGMLSFTYVKEQEVFAWAQHETLGAVKDILCVEEDDKDVVYLIVERLLNGRWVKMLERFAQRDVDYVDDYWGVDCGLRTAITRPAAQLTLSAATGTCTVEASAAVFLAGDVGKVVRAGKGKGTITTFIDTTTVEMSIVRDFTTLSDDTTPARISNGSWSMDENVMTVGGAWHLEGEDVSILADGNLLPSQTVVDGAIALPVAASRVVLGLPFTAKAQTLPLTAGGTVIEGKRKRVVGISIRVDESRGLALGRDDTRTYEIKDRTTELYGEPTIPFSGVKHIAIEPRYEEDGSIYIEQAYPLPATVLGLVLDIEVGDEDA